MARSGSRDWTEWVSREWKEARPGNPTGTTIPRGRRFARPRTADRDRDLDRDPDLDLDPDPDLDLDLDPDLDPDRAWALQATGLRALAR